MPKKLTTEEFIKKARNMHGNKYDYSKTDYILSNIKICIICQIHGEFYQKPGDHLNGRGCYKCGKKRAGKVLTSTTAKFINKAKKIHGNDYDYSFVEYINTETKVKINCKKHGIFLQTPHKHLMGRGCPSCRSSIGEKTIREYLLKTDIEFEEQKRFHDCRNILPLPFDFYLPKNNMLIEYDGELHFKKSRRRNGEEKLFKTIEHDKIKNNFCDEKNIKLIRIPYWIEDLEECLDKDIKRSR